MQVVNAYLCRNRRASVASPRFFKNLLITFGVVAEIGLILAIDYTAAGHAMFGTAPLGYQAWLVILPFAMVMLAIEEARKAFVRRRERTGPT